MRALFFVARRARAVALQYLIGPLVLVFTWGFVAPRHSHAIISNSFALSLFVALLPLLLAAPPRLRSSRGGLAIAVALVGLAGCAGPAGLASSLPRAEPAPIAVSGPLKLVQPVVETDAVPHDGDAADDPAIWVHPTDPAQSLIIGTDKRGGLAVYDLAGKQLQYVPEGRKNNVDLRAGFALAGQDVALVTASDRTDNHISIYRVNPETRRLEDVAARRVITGAGYGACMYHSAATGRFYYIVNSEQGLVEQWELFDNGAGMVDAVMARSFQVGGSTEGCVADDRLGYLYIGEEDVGIWKYGAEPGAGVVRTSVDTTHGGHLISQVEGLALYDAGAGQGYLIASSQGANSFVIYRREGANDYVDTFAIAAGNGIDRVSVTDGIDVTSANLGPAFPQGMLIAQDDSNGRDNQNFKVVPWHAILAAIAEPAPDSAISGQTHR
jgi:3-phytase